jgi:hypothetical protein
MEIFYLSKPPFTSYPHSAFSPDPTEKSAVVGGVEKRLEKGLGSTEAHAQVSHCTMHVLLLFSEAFDIFVVGHKRLRKGSLMFSRT